MHPRLAGAGNVSIQREAGLAAQALPCLRHHPVNSEARTMLQQGLVVFAQNKKRVSAFYRQALGLEVQESDSSHDLLRGHGYEVVVHTIPRKYAAGISISKPPQSRDETPFKPSFVVPSLAAVRMAAESTGGYLKPVDDAWRFRGHVVLDGWDPEGNIVQVKQAE